MDRHLLDYLPPVVSELREIQLVMNAEQPEIEMLWQSFSNALNDQFVTTATESGVERWEKILKIYPKATDSLTDRKFTILTRVNEQLPFTVRILESQLKALCSADGYSIVVDSDNYSIIVKVALEEKSNYEAVKALLKRVIPANMVLDVTLKYNQNELLKKYTHGQLKPYTHEQLKSEVIV